MNEKLLMLQNAGGFYGFTVVKLPPNKIEDVRNKLRIMGPDNFIKINDKLVIWSIIDSVNGVANYNTGGKEAEADVVKLLGLS